MKMGKGAYLKKITESLRLKSVNVGKELAGASPPSVFIGSYNYPKVFAGPMIAPDPALQSGPTEASIMDSPERWIPERRTQEDILGFRLNLVRGKHEVDAKDVSNRFVTKLQDIALAERAVDSETSFHNQPRGFTLNEDHLPFGPSGYMDDFSVGNSYWERHMQKAYYDTDLRSTEAVVRLHRDNVPFSQIQKAFSVGSFGLGKNRRLVPTRWSITAVDSALADDLLDKVRHYEVLDHYEVYEFSALHNRYVAILLPTAWQYEWTEAFLHVMGDDTDAVFSDYETNRGKKEYSSVGGCYYTCKFRVLEHLERMKKQAGAIVLREAYSGYLPMGVFNVRENLAQAFRSPHREFSTLRSALACAMTGFRLPLQRFMDEGQLLGDLLKGRQTTL